MTMMMKLGRAGSCCLLPFLYAFIVISFISSSYARPSVAEVLLSLPPPHHLSSSTSSSFSHRYSAVRRFSDDSLPTVNPLSSDPPNFCASYTPFTPPSATTPTTGSYTPSPPTPTSSSSYPTSPTLSPPQSYSNPSNPPASVFPGPPASTYQPNPPSVSPPPYSYEPTPPAFSFPSPPTGFIPAPPLFEPPVVYPPPIGPPPSYHGGPSSALWCVAKPSVPDPIIQEAMDYACGSGADCDSLQPNGDCFQPDTLFAHASYAFNSFWQRTKVAGGTCEFGGSAMLVTVDPSYDGCHFIYF